MTQQALAANARDVACWYMQRKGFADLRPHQTLQLENVNCWYFYFSTDEGEVELEVFYDRQRQPSVKVTTFTPNSRERHAAAVDAHQDRSELPAGSAPGER